MTKTLTPIGNNILVKPTENETTTASGIVIPDTITKEKTQIAEVLAVPSTKLLDNNKNEVTISVGDKIVFRQYSETEIKHEGATYFVIGADAVLATVCS